MMPRKPCEHRGPPSFHMLLCGLGKFMQALTVLGAHMYEVPVAHRNAKCLPSAGAWRKREPWVLELLYRGFGKCFLCTYCVLSIEPRATGGLMCVLCSLPARPLPGIAQSQTEDGFQIRA